jgi:hypothetical protein
MEGKVPTPHGEISVYCSRNNIKIKSDGGSGILKIKSAKKPVVKDTRIEAKGSNVYEISIDKDRTYNISYQAPK